jgi:hypothetical protein
MGRETGNIMCRRINEATAFRKLFSRDINSDLKVLGLFHVR